MHTHTPTLSLLLACIALAACQSSGTPAAPDPGSPASGAVAAQSAVPAPSGSIAAMNECPGGHDEACGQRTQPAADQQHFGAAFTLPRAEPLAKVAAGLEAEGKLVQVSGTVESVCQMAGCWMVLRDGQVRARVFTKKHGFFLRKDIAGEEARAEGKLQPRMIGERFAKHLDRDRGGGGATGSGPRRELVMDATAVELD